MTAERISGARKRACFHRELIRILPPAADNPVWLCLNCKDCFDLLEALGTPMSPDPLATVKVGV
jgi:hypothetical protein